MASRETAAHHHLKHLAGLWARQHGYSAVATEVQLPNSSFRADVAAYRRVKGPQNGESIIGDTPCSSASKSAPISSRTHMLWRRPVASC